MKTAFPLPVLLLLGSFFFSSLEAARILCLVSTAKHSNPGWSRPLLDALVAKGHHLTVLSSEPNENPKTGLVYYHLPNEYDVMQKHFIDQATGEYKPMVSLKQLLVWYEVILGSCHSIMESDTMQRMLPELTAHLTLEFDLIITDVTEGSDCLLDIRPLLGSKPFLGLSAGKLTPDLMSLLEAENTISAAKIPHHLSQVPKSMSFWNRLHNHVMYLTEPIIQSLIIRPVLHKLVPSGNAFPSLQLVLLNTHPVVDYIQNLPPGVIEVGGLHIKNATNRLPNYIEEFSEKFIDGIVYINMPYIESMIEGVGIEAMTKMIQKNPNCGFIWNVKEMKILPADMPNLLTLHVNRSLQQDILAKTEVRGFLNHGDSLDIQEAVYYGVPVVVIPLNLEQFNNAQRVEERYLGVVIPAKEFHLNVLSEALKLILDVEYFTTALYQAQLKFRSRPQSALELAIWHAEQMIDEPRFYKDLAQVEANQQNFFVAHSLDVLAVPALLVLFFVLNLLHVVFSLLKGRPKPQEPKKRKKAKKVVEIKEPEQRTLNQTLSNLSMDLLEDLNEEIIEGEQELFTNISSTEAEKDLLLSQEEKPLEDKKED